MYLMVQPATGPSAPMTWLPSAGVPTVDVCFKPSTKNASHCDPSDVRQYPYYFAPAYYALWRAYHQALHDWLVSLPRSLRQRVQTVQVSLGSTGDITGWHGVPLDPKYADVNNNTLWQDFWVNGSLAMVEVWRDLVPDTKLLFNAVPPLVSTADQEAWPAYRHVIMDVLKPPNFAAKFGVLSHQWFTNYEQDDYTNSLNLTRTPFAAPGSSGAVDFVRSRGEMSDGSNATGSCGEAFWGRGLSLWNMWNMVSWQLTAGLDVLNPNPQIWSREDSGSVPWSPKLWAAFNHYHVYGGHKIAADSPGAWISLRDGLDEVQLRAVAPQ